MHFSFLQNARHVPLIQLLSFAPNPLKSLIHSLPQLSFGLWREKREEKEGGERTREESATERNSESARCIDTWIYNEVFKVDFY